MKGTAFALISFVLTLATASARAGVIEGVVKDRKSGDALIGANAKVVGTNLGAATDLDGHYAISNVPDGIYSLRIFYGGFTPKVQTGVAVTGDRPVRVDVELEPISSGDEDAMRIEDIYVTAERVRNTNAAILTERQRSAVIGDGISQEQIRLSPDGTSSDALKRVTGLSIVNNKYVFIRGVTDRYNSTTLNGIGVTSTDTDADKKSFSFDLIPASLISNTVVAKTATPDLPGDFSGGLVQVSTLDFPTGFMANATVESGYDKVSSRKDILVAPGGYDDWKAEDDGSRARPPDLEGNALALALPNTWGLSGDRSRNNGSYALTLGNSFHAGGNEIGVIASGTYKNNYKVEEYHQEPTNPGDQRPIFEYDGTRYRERVLMGALVNLAYRPTRDHKITFENDYTRASQNKATQAEGLPESGDGSRTQTITWDQRDLYLGQLAGDHHIAGLHDLKIDWRLAYSTSDASQPDQKYAEYQPDARGNYLLKDNYRTWSELSEDSRTGLMDVEMPIGGRANLKTGYYQFKRERDSSSEAWTTDTSKLRGANQAIKYQTIDEVFKAENYGPNLLQFLPSTAFTGDYSGTHELKAYYGMADVPFRIAGQNFRAVGGARVEDSRQEVDSPWDLDPDSLVASVIDKKDVLPSVNLSWQVTRSSALRLGYFSSVNRPEFREMANVLFRDYDRNQNVIGNPELKRAVIKNYDVRAEWYPSANEVVAASWFYKDLTDAIEEQLLPSPDKYVRTWFNSPAATNYGYELELRKDLGFIWGGLENLVIQTNYTRVKSDVEYTESRTDAQGNPVTETGTRTMQGQAPYTFNAGINYTVPGIRLSMSLLYNKFGRRLEAVGDTRDQDIWEESRDLYDFALTEEFARWMRLKFSIKDIAADDVTYTFGDTGSIWEQIKAGTTYAISLSFNL